MYKDQKIWIGTAQEQNISILPSMANRHGLIAGATGTGKTTTVKVLAESFSAMGVPVFLTDVKGDLSGLCEIGEIDEEMLQRLASFGLTPEQAPRQSYPVCFWDIFGEGGIPLRTTISDMGPILLARLLSLNATQSDVLRMVFKIADDDGLLLIDTKDLRLMLQHVYEHTKDYSVQYGNLAKQSITAIMRSVMSLEEEGGEVFFGEPALNITDWFSADMSGKGMINLLDCRALVTRPLLYATFLLWMLSELYETLPEVGDMDKPRMIFFFDEAHLLFEDAPKALLQKIEQIVKLIRSKGVGIYFCTQNPSDIPDEVLAQLGNKVQHALHAYTPAEQKKVKAAADSFRSNPQFNTLTVLSELGTGEALVSFLDEEGRPGIVERTRILPPDSKKGAIPEELRRQKAEQHMLYIRYANMVDRESAYEVISAMQEEQQRQQEEILRQKEEEAQRKLQEKEEAARAKEEAAQLRLQQREEAARAREEAAKEREASRLRKKQTAAAASVAKTATGTIGRELGKEIGGKMGGSFGKRLGGNVGSAIGRGLLGTLFKS